MLFCETTIRGVIQNYVDFCYNFKTDKQRKPKLCIQFVLFILQVCAKFEFIRTSIVTSMAL